MTLIPELRPPLAELFTYFKEIRLNMRLDYVQLQVISFFFCWVYNLFAYFCLATGAGR